MQVRKFIYKKGIKLPNIKSVDTSSNSVTIDEPDRVFVNTKMCNGTKVAILVSAEEKVSIGSLLAKSNQTSIFSPISGVVKGVAKIPSIHGGIVDHIVIDNDKKSTIKFFTNLNKEKLDKVIVLKRVLTAGIVDGDGFPLFQKFILPENSKVDTLIVNCCRDEPFVSNSITYLSEYTNQVYNGAKYLAIAGDLKNISFAVTKSIYKKISKFRNFLKNLKNEKYNVTIDILPNRYPVGDETELITAVTGKTIPFGKNSSIYGKIMVDVSSAYNVSKAIDENLVESTKLITVISPYQPKICHLWVKIGASIESIARSLNINLDLISKIVAGGPMRGLSICNTKAVVTKTIQALMFMTENQVDSRKEKDCINCGKCYNICPMKLNPREIEKYAMKEAYLETKKLGALYCSNCGCCSYVCPAKRHLVQRIADAKEFINKKEV